MISAGKVFYLTLSGEGRHPVMHFGMTGMLQVSLHAVPHHPALLGGVLTVKSWFRPGQRPTCNLLPGDSPESIHGLATALHESECAFAHPPALPTDSSLDQTVHPPHQRTHRRRDNAGRVPRRTPARPHPLMCVPTHRTPDLRARLRPHPRHAQRGRLQEGGPQTFVPCEGAAARPVVQRGGRQLGSRCVCASRPTGIIARSLRDGLAWSLRRDPVSCTRASGGALQRAL